MDCEKTDTIDLIKANARFLYGRDRTYDVVTCQATDEGDKVGDTTAALVAYHLPSERDGQILMMHTLRQANAPITVPKAINVLAKTLRHDVARYDKYLKNGMTFTGLIIGSHT